MFTVLEFILQQLDRAANCMTCELHNAAVERDPAVHRCKEAKSTFAAYVGGLDSGAILQNRQRRENRTPREIGVLEKTTRVADHLTELEIDGLEMGIYPLAAGRLQGAEQSIASKVMIGLRFGHRFRSI
jgi:hypothetical protein